MPQDFSTQTASPGATGTCPDDCEEAMAQVQNEVNEIKRIPGAIDRNVAITEAYDTLAREMPENDWVRLASYVSVQGGCAMKEADSFLSRMAPDFYISADGMLDALRDANTTIFESIYPPNRFVANCGYEKFRECVASGEIEVQPEIREAIGAMEAGDNRRAADLIARYEQETVVQAVYERHPTAFEDMAQGEGWMPGDQTSIPIAKSCTRENLVSLGSRDITNPTDRVSYYHDLMDRMLEIEGQ